MQFMYTNILEHFNFIFKFKNMYEASGRTNLEMKEKIDTAINNLEEDLHSIIEGRAAPYLDKVCNGDISFYDDERYRALFNHYLATQYLRTNHMKERMKTRFNAKPQVYVPFGMNIERIWNVISHMLATHLSLVMSEGDGYMQLILLSNSTRTPFITSDQPIINKKSNNIGYVAPTEWELYYPVTPDIALVLSEKNKSQYSGNLTEIEVFELNNGMVAASEEQVYASERHVLERYL